MSLQKKSGIVKAATGSGKSIMIAQLIANTNVKTMIYVIGVDLLYQMHEMFKKIFNVKIGIIGDGQAEIGKINLCTIWTAANVVGKKYVPLDDEDRSRKEILKHENKVKIKKAIEEAEMVIYDECHFVSTDTVQTINKSSKNAYFKFGFSGTPWREDNADLLIEGVIGERIIDITASEMINGGYLVQPTIHFIDIPEMKQLPNKYQSIYKIYIVENRVRNEKIVKAVNKLVDSGRRVLVLVKTIAHGKILLRMLENAHLVYFVRGELDSDERNYIRKEFINSNLKIVISTCIFDQGIDVPNLDSLVLSGGGKASGRALQRLGRVLRPCSNKNKAIIIDFIDNAKYLLEHSEKRIEIYRTEAGFKIKLPEKYMEKKEAQRKAKIITW